MIRLADFRFLPSRETRARLGLRSKTTQNQRVAAGLLTPGVDLGGGDGGPKGWPDYEVTAINAARLAGVSNDKIRLLVDRLLAARTSGVLDFDAIRSDIGAAVATSVENAARQDRDPCRGT